MNLFMFWINAIIWAIIIGIGIWQSKPKPLTIAFIISLYVGLGVYIYVRPWVFHLPMYQIIMFFGIPISLFFFATLLYCLITKTNWETASTSFRCWFVGAIVSIWITFPTVFMLYDWQTAKHAYNEDMKDVLMEDWDDEMDEESVEEWEEEIEDMEEEAIFRRR